MFPKMPEFPHLPLVGLAVNRSFLYERLRNYSHGIAYSRVGAFLCILISLDLNEVRSLIYLGKAE